MLRLRALLPVAAAAALTGCVNLCDHSWFNWMNGWRRNNCYPSPCTTVDGCFTTTGRGPYVVESGPILGSPTTQSFTSPYTPEQMPAPRLVTPPNNARPVPFVPERK